MNSQVQAPPQAKAIGETTGIMAKITTQEETTLILPRPSVIRIIAGMTIAAVTDVTIEAGMHIEAIPADHNGG